MTNTHQDCIEHLNTFTATITDIIHFDSYVFAFVEGDNVDDDDPWQKITPSEWPIAWPPQKGDVLRMSQPTILEVIRRSVTDPGSVTDAGRVQAKI